MPQVLTKTRGMAVRTAARTISPSLQGHWFNGPILAPNIPDASGKGRHMVPFVGAITNLLPITARTDSTAVGQIGAVRDLTIPTGKVILSSLNDTGTTGVGDPTGLKPGATVADGTVNWKVLVHPYPGTAVWGSTSVIMKAGDASVLDITVNNRSFILSFWFMFGVVISGGGGAVLSRYDPAVASASRTGCLLGIADDASGRKVRCIWCEAGTNLVLTFDGATAPSLGVMHHYMIARDQQTSIKMYLDGVLDYSASPFNLKPNTTAETLIGAAGTAAAQQFPMSSMTQDVYLRDEQLYYRDSAITEDTAVLAKWLYQHPGMPLSAGQFA